MPHTRGSSARRKRFTWRYDPQLERVTTTSKDGIVHTYTVHEIQAVLQHLAGQFGDAFFPLANNVAKLGAGTEQPGLGTAILAQQPGDTTHAQGASYLGVVLEEAGYLEWNGKHRGIAWRLIDRDFAVDALATRLQAVHSAAPPKRSPIKAVIQCSGTKQGPWWTWKGKPVKFVAHPERCHPDDTSIYARPDDPIPGLDITWRRALIAYNEHGKNPDGLLRAADLYKPDAYRRLVDHCGWENTYILSAGWGLVRAGFFLPKYDITFSSHADVCNRRAHDDEYEDYNHLVDADLQTQDTLYFFGGQSYLPLYYELARALPMRKVIYHKARQVDRESGFEYIHYRTRRSTNWHYSCVEAFVNEEIER